MNKTNVKPAEGKLGVLVVGLGALILPIYDRASAMVER